ncbi:fibronectin type III domain-containing protein [Cellulomonas massiliensis]|uniref:fibronectin type III domain-containing protein n=1 Tax=Cellulomonas massiliensis TaxID=1465811 RepID=UPI00036207D0|nr:fibronectin type III domain-containing protein [Cellulomonas massiliensis]
MSTLVGVALIVSGLTATGAAAAGPESPTGLTTGALGTDTVFRWDRVDGATGYTVELSATPEFDAIVATASTTARSWVPTSAIDSSAARTLYWHVAAHSSGVTAASRGDFSEASVLERDATPAPAPVAPADGSSVTYPDATVFSWGAVPGAVTYTLEYSSNPDFPADANVTKTVSTSSTSYSLTAPLARKAGVDDIRWYWRVRANVASGSTTVAGATSAASSFTVVWPSAASRPTPLSPTDPTRTYSDLRFSWTPVVGASYYEVVVGTEKTGDLANGTVLPSSVRTSATTTSTTYVPLDAMPDAVYYWQVTAFDAAGNPGKPSVISVVTKDWGLQVPDSGASDSFAKAYPAPSFGTSDAAAPTQVTLQDLVLTWQPVPRATLYEVEVIPLNGDPRLTCRTASTSATIIAKLGEGTTSPDLLVDDKECLWTGTDAERIQAGRSYQWRVRAIDYSGSATTKIQSPTPSGALVSQWSDMEDNDASRRRYFDVVGSAPTGAETAVPDAAAWAEERSAHQGQPAPLFTWAPVAGVNAYIVEVYRDAGLTNHVGTWFTPSTALRINGVFDDTTSGSYYWRVQGTVANTSWSTFTTPAGSVWSAPQSWEKSSTPTALTDQPATVAPDGSVVLSWLPQAQTAPFDGGSRGYQVTIYDSSDNVRGSRKVEYPWYVAKETSTQDPLPIGSYRFTVAPLDALGNPGKTSPSQPFEVTAPAPSAPSAVTSASGVVLRWRNTAAAASYKVQYRPVGASTWKSLPASGTLSETAVAVPDVAPGQYEWAVQSLDSKKYGSTWTATQTFTVAPGVPTVVTAPGAVLPTSDRTLDWDAVPGASRYLVRIATSAAGTASATPVETSATAYVPTSATTLAYGTAYYWTVTAVGGTKTVVLGTSAPRAFTVTTPPVAPAIKTATTSGDTVAVDWAAPTVATRGSAENPSYTLRYRAMSSTGEETAWTVVEVGPDALAATVGNLATATTYELQLQASNSDGRSAWSASKTVTTAGVPGVVRTLTATPSASGLVVKWLAPSTNGGSSVTSYLVQYQLDGATTWSSTTSSTTTATLGSLKSGSTYNLRVSARNAIGTGPAATYSVRTLTPASAPTSATVTRGDRSAIVKWGAPTSSGSASITAFVVEVRSYSATSKTWSAWATKSTTTASARSATLTSLTNGTKYDIRVAAKTSVGLGAYSPVLRAVPAGKPKAPTNVKATSPKARYAKLTWTKAADNGAPLTRYVLQYSTNGTTWKTLKTVSGTTTSYTWTGATSKKKYYFRLYAENAVGKSAVSSRVYVTVR